MSNFFAADHHLYHEGIIQACNRPFNTTRQMNKTLVKNHNDIISDNDDVYFIGDFSMLSPWDTHMIEKVLQQMNGRKHLILGNHDRQRPFDLIDAGFISVHTHLELELNNQKYILIHDPVASCLNRSIPFLCGHVHDLFKTQKNVINVGVDVWDYKPISLNQIEELI